MMFVDRFAGMRRFELLRDQHDRLEPREERRPLLDELELERRERLEAQESQTAHAGVPTPGA